jgi:hypothetical protein
MSAGPRIVEVRQNTLKHNDVVARALRERFTHNWPTGRYATPLPVSDLCAHRTSSSLRGAASACRITPSLAPNEGESRLRLCGQPAANASGGAREGDRHPHGFGAVGDRRDSTRPQGRYGFSGEMG